MKSITIHNLEDKLYNKLKDMAQSKDLSLNKTIKKLLEKALGIKEEKGIDNRKEFQEFCGVWSEEDNREFQDNIKDIEVIDPSDWQ